MNNEQWTQYTGQIGQQWTLFGIGMDNKEIRTNKANGKYQGQLTEWTIGQMWTMDFAGTIEKQGQIRAMGNIKDNSWNGQQLDKCGKNNEQVRENNG